jgi:hypothetical protein
VKFISKIREAITSCLQKSIIGGNESVHTRCCLCARYTSRNIITS